MMSTQGMALKPLKANVLSINTRIFIKIKHIKLAIKRNRYIIKAKATSLKKGNNIGGGPGVTLNTPYDRVYNFSAGPACLPVEVLESVQKDLINYKGTGMSVMEMSHRGEIFDNIAKEAEESLRRLIKIPDTYHVLFLQGGASTQFSAVPLNLSLAEDTVDHVITGSWSKKATSEAKRLCNVNVAVAGDNKSIPPQSDWKLSPNAKYLHYCDNETIQGVEFPFVPDVQVPLVADMSSNFCSKPFDINKYGVVYAGAQKNIGPAGVTVVIVKSDLIGNARPDIPIMLDWKTMAETNSMYNTPPCFSLYVCGLVFKHIIKLGGLETIEQVNNFKAKLVYDCIKDSNGFYANPVNSECQSVMNVPFTIPVKPELEKIFIKEAAGEGLVTLKGHRSVGGMRASIYNSFPEAGVQALVDFMKKFAFSHR